MRSQSFGSLALRVLNFYLLFFWLLDLFICLFVYLFVFFIHSNVSPSLSIFLLRSLSRHRVRRRVYLYFSLFISESPLARYDFWIPLFFSIFFFLFFFLKECSFIQRARGLFRTRPRRGKCRPWRPPSAHPEPRTLEPL